MATRTQAVLVLLVLLAACGGAVGPDPALPPAIVHNALLFDGVDDLAIAVGSGTFLNGLTMEAWIRADSGAQQVITTCPVLAEGAASVAFTGNSLGGSVCIPGCNGPTSAQGSIIPGAWHHLALTYDGAQVRLFIDGVPAGSTPHPGTANGYSQIKIGRFGGTFPGAIDEVRIWDVPRTQAQIQATMHSVLTGSEAGLRDYWRFEEGAGQTVADLAGGDHPAVLGSTGGADADDPQWIVSGAPVS